MEKDMTDMTEQMDLGINKRVYTTITGPMAFDMRRMRNNHMKLKDIAAALGCSKTAVSAYTSGPYKDAKPAGYPNSTINGEHVALTSEMLEYLTAIRVHMKIDASDAVARGLWALLEQLTADKHTKTYEELMQNVELQRGAYMSNAAPQIFKPGEAVEVINVVAPKKPTIFERIYDYFCSPAGY